MPDAFCILFVDDEETFLCSTVDLLRREGYACDGASGVSDARRLLDERPYDLVIADIKMPGNSDLEFIHQLSRQGEAQSIILVTGHPSIASAIQSVELPVIAYLVKPFDFSELLAKVRHAAQRSAVQRVVRNELERLQEYREGLMKMQMNVTDQPRAACSSSLQAVVGITLRSIVDGLSDLHALTDASHGDEAQGALKHWSPPLPGELRSALCDAVATLERTRDSFKSKELGNLRKRLEALLRT
jgi:response regulator RpfG family c-di-GMP phosphodiesterase